ncbi:uncharacterized protein BDZ99DRAFT_576186 [Mytilinidion resinicola]|uniref:Uncharacterized protein n=1 Tax=Mytilinidion resinicola TaxID=574789 RepID=A0A6A6Y3B5_9PEZI|nr:uncharacterized protein BDZ99DRAFT_576186 [Mytilinidion resinicola]KAF2803272.1 hypothetical protein BDZ99DRAFT_576186 [Mytilinidion resinicola]
MVANTRPKRENVQKPEQHRDQKAEKPAVAKTVPAEKVKADAVADAKKATHVKKAAADKKAAAAKKTEAAKKTGAAKKAATAKKVSKDGTAVPLQSDVVVRGERDGTATADPTQQDDDATSGNRNAVNDDEGNPVITPEGSDALVANSQAGADNGGEGAATDADVGSGSVVEKGSGSAVKVATVHRQLMDPSIMRPRPTDGEDDEECPSKRIKYFYAAQANTIVTNSDGGSARYQLGGFPRRLLRAKVGLQIRCHKPTDPRACWNCCMPIPMIRSEPVKVGGAGANLVPGEIAHATILSKSGCKAAQTGKRD